MKMSLSGVNGANTTADVQSTATDESRNTGAGAGDSPPDTGASTATGAAGPVDVGGLAVGF